MIKTVATHPTFTVLLSHLHDGIEEEDDDADGVERHQDAHRAAASTPSTLFLSLKWDSVKYRIVDMLADDQPKVS